MRSCNPSAESFSVLPGTPLSEHSADNTAVDSTATQPRTVPLPGSADGCGDATSILVQGNISGTWTGNLILAGALAVVCLGIAIAMASFGYWLILPFAGLEVVCFTTALYWTLKKLSRREVITIDDHSITLEWGYNKPDRSVRLPRYWSKLVYHRPTKPMDMGAVSLQAHGKRYVLGSSLGRVEKKELYTELHSILGVSASGVGAS